MQYAWKTGTVRCHPQVAGDFLEAARLKNDGLITPAIIVRLARPKRSPLHRAFEWDDAAAAHQNRLDQAGEILRQLVIKVTKDDRELVTRAFVNIRSVEGGGSYTSIHIAMNDQEMREAVLEDAWRELETFRRKYADFEELLEIMNVIDTIGKQRA